MLVYLFHTSSKTSIQRVTDAFDIAEVASNNRHNADIMNLVMNKRSIDYTDEFHNKTTGSSVYNYDFDENTNNS